MGLVKEPHMQGSAQTQDELNDDKPCSRESADEV